MDLEEFKIATVLLGFTYKCNAKMTRPYRHEFTDNTGNIIATIPASLFDGEPSPYAHRYHIMWKKGEGSLGYVAKTGEEILQQIIKGNTDD